MSNGKLRGKAGKARQPAERPASPAPAPGSPLRDRAEAACPEISSLSQEGLKLLSPDAMHNMVHELRVHQIELEMQNEELRRTQLDLDVMRARYFDLYDLAPVGYCTVSDTGLIQQSNLTAATMVGMKRGDLTQLPLSRLVHEDDQDILYLHRRKLADTGEAQAFDVRMKRRGGVPFWGHLVATVASGTDGASAYWVALTDITETKNAQAELVHAREMAEAATRVKSEFLANMSHEIRTPLNGVIGNAQLLAMSALGSEQKEFVAAITASSNNLLCLINDILDLSKIEARMVVLEKADFSPRDCIRDAVLMQRTRIARKGLSLKVDIADAVPGVLMGDELRVKQILLNLSLSGILCVRHNMASQRSRYAEEEEGNAGDAGCCGQSRVA